jgi:hypothetical protein
MPSCSVKWKRVCGPRLPALQRVGWIDVQFEYSILAVTPSPSTRSHGYATQFTVCVVCEGFWRMEGLPPAHGAGWAASC